MNDIPLELALLIFEYLPGAACKMRLAQTCRSFCLAARHPSIWDSLGLQSVGLAVSARTGRRIDPSPEHFLESLFLFLKQPRFRLVKRVNAARCYLGEPSLFVSCLLLLCCPDTEELDLTECEPDFSWSFLRLRSIPLSDAAELLRLPRLKLVTYGGISWSVQVGRKGRSFNRI